MRKLENSELGRLEADAFRQVKKVPICVVLDNVRSSHNTGSLFRTGDALLIEKLYLCGITATPPDKEIRKTALGAEHTVEWEYAASTEEVAIRLKKEGYLVIAIEQVENSISLTDYLPPEGAKLALIFGNEVKGVQQEVVDLCDFALEIPQYGTKHSFNVSVSAGIVLWDLFNKIGHQRVGE
ncbi:MAG: RNA methyltransferase [Marinilabiliales bacterium]|nr:RNA methyltransferase [Marinilabiliales bacterium]